MRPQSGQSVRVDDTAQTGWASAWQKSWDLLEEGLVPDREQRIAVLLDVVDAMVGGTPTVIDLACGTGTITCRLLERFPLARVVAVDIDPVLLTIASETFADDDRVRVVRADLRDPAWVDELPEQAVDAVLTATALHWLPAEVVQRLYRDLARLVRRGGVVAHTEEMPLVEVPCLGDGLTRLRKRRTGMPRADACWDAWWEQAAQDPALAAATTQRQAVFETNYPTEEFSPPADWHISALIEAGFTEAGVVWRAGAGAVVAALR
jgi:SAM-dependent methyltransferase